MFLLNEKLLNLEPNVAVILVQNYSENVDGGLPEGKCMFALQLLFITYVSDAILH